MKILAFEYACAGGEGGEPFVRDGRLMLSTLLNDMTKAGIGHVSTLLHGSFDPDGIKADEITAAEPDFFTAVEAKISNADAVWIIAPECGGTLLDLSTMVLAQGKTLIGCRPEAVEVCGSKMKTAELLCGNNNNGKIKMPETELLYSAGSRKKFPCVVKPVDGAGCEEVYYVENREELKRLDTLNENFIVQPYVHGESLSAGILTAGSGSTLLGVCRHEIFHRGSKMRLKKISGLIKYDRNDEIKKMIDEITRIIPGLRGFWGLDFIHRDSAPPVLVEINPRLTTSYPVYSRSCGFNIASKTVRDACGLVNV
ncbi:MAG: hypothetical protein IEMM0002_1070 [bacterium]|nr:MAG: hypothetical protein IEMM0002_1070 [bacterium]